MQCLQLQFIQFALFLIFKINYTMHSAAVSAHSVYGNVITYLCSLFLFLFILAHGTKSAWKTYISLQEAALHIQHTEHQKYKAVLYYISQREKSPENLKSQARPVHEGEQHKHSQEAPGFILPDTALVCRPRCIAEKLVV